MTRGQAQQAIDAAFADGIKQLFAVLVKSQSDPEAIGRFDAGVANHATAHAQASASVERIFPD